MYTTKLEFNEIKLQYFHVNPFSEIPVQISFICIDVYIKFQINFFEDHTKIILCPLMGAVTYIDEKRNFKTYRLASLEKVNIKF